MCLLNCPEGTQEAKGGAGVDQGRTEAWQGGGRHLSEPSFPYS